MDKVLADKIKEYERLYSLSKENKEDPYKLLYHLMPPAGWLNDPNGLCQLNGVYHIFFQYSPFEAQGGMKCWGHYTSKDFINYKYEGVSLLPDTKWDKDGAYSGSTFVKDGEMYIFYTGNTKVEGDYDYVLNGRGANTILVTSMDGIELSDKVVVMTNDDYPDNYSCHVRDPKVWKKNGKYYMVQGARTVNDRGAVIVFESDDLLNWKVVNEVTTDDKFGYMWECPDYFELIDEDGTETNILSVSPQGLDHGRTQFQNEHQSGYFYLKGDITRKCEPTDFVEWDMGFDFYAPQSFTDERGRRILIGWVGLPDMDYTNPTISYGWQHTLTMPRELIVQHGRIYQVPVEEFEGLRECEINIVDNKSEIKQYELLIENIEANFKIQIAEGVLLTRDNEELVLSMDEQSGSGRKERVLANDNISSVRIFVDNSIAEIFINGGEYTFTSRMYSKNVTPKIVNGCESATINLWKLKGFIIEE